MSGDDLQDGIRLGLLFGAAFFASRVMLRVDGHRAMTRWLARSATSGFGLCWRLVAVSALISSVVPNVMTVLAMLPVVHSATEHLPDQQRSRARTALGLAVLYGGSLGSLITLVGSPQNGLLLGMLAYRNVPGHEALTPVTWTLIGAPLAAILCSVAAGVLGWLERESLRFDPDEIRIVVSSTPAIRRRAGLVVGLVIPGAVILGLTGAPLLVTVPVFLVWVGALFVVPLPSDAGPILRPGDVFAEIPWKGVGLVVGAVVFGVVLDRLGLVDTIVVALMDWMPSVSEVPTLFLVSLGTIFLTEVLSNTATALAMWPLAEALAQSNGFSALPLMCVIGVAANCAFMSPVGTGATAMAFGGLDGLRVKRLVLVGALVNLSCGVTIATAAWLLG